jgi:peptidoglycan hydrolase CwlO-like protein
VARLQEEVSAISRRLDVVTARVEGLEAEMVRLNQRVDSLSDEMRQRFRVVTDNLAALAA